MIGASPIGADPIGAMFDEAVALAALGTARGRRKARFLARRIRIIIRRAGETALIVSRDEKRSYNGKIALSMTAPSEKIGRDLAISGYMLTIPAQDLLDKGFPLPLEPGVVVYRFADQARERGIRLHEKPAVLRVDDVDLVYRCTSQG